MKVRYFLISNMWPSGDNPGYGSFVRNIVDGLEDNSYECTCRAVIVGRPKSMLDKLRRYLQFYVSIILNYFKDYEFIYIHFPNQALPILIPLFLIKRKKVIVNLHGEDLLYKDRGLSGMLGRMNDWFLSKVDAAVVPSDYYRQVALERIHCNPEKILVSPSGGISPSAFYPERPEASDSSVTYIGYVGRIDPNKGWRQFVEVVSRLPEDFKFKATLIGTGSEVGDLKKEIESVKPRDVEYVSHVVQHELRKYYSRFDLLIFPTMRKEESLGLVGIEAMACGTPVIGSDIGGIPSYLKDETNGFLVEPGNVDAIIDRVLRYSEMSADEKEAMKMNCIERSKAYYTHNVAEELARKFNEILG